MKVSIIIPYNESRGFLGAAVESCERQENMRLGKDYEIIVQHGDCSLGRNVNEAVKKCKGRYIKICADDDMLAPGCLHALYQAAKGYDFICADAYDFENDKQILSYRQSVIPRKVCQLSEANTIHGGTILYRRSVMPRWDEDYWCAEEFDVTIRMAAAGCKFGKVDEVVYWYRVHGGQKSIKNKTVEGDTILKRLRFVRDKIQFPYANHNFKIVR